MATVSQGLLRTITSPGRLASLVDHGGRNCGTLMTLQIKRHHIGMVVAWGPRSEQEDDIGILPKIPLYGRDIPFETCIDLAEIVREFDVRGFVVGWPVQQYSGNMGASCGRVLYSLEEMISQQQQHQPDLIFSPERPLCFWVSPQVHMAPPDVWGRSPALSYRTPINRTMHLASKEQYWHDETLLAVDVWQDFWKTHWPHLYQRNKECIAKQMAAEHAAAVALENMAPAHRIVETALVLYNQVPATLHSPV